MSEFEVADANQKLGEEVSELKDEAVPKPCNDKIVQEKVTPDAPVKDKCIPESTNDVSEIEISDEVDTNPVDDSADDVINDDILAQVYKRELMKKRYSVDIKKSRMDFKRFSVDYRRDTATLEELARLEQKLAQTNFDVRPGGRRKSTGILKTSVSTGSGDQKSFQEPSSDDDDVFEKGTPESTERPTEPPATPVGRDELALRRHRFFSDLVCAARAAVEHRVRFDPLGPVVAEPGGETEATAAFHSPAADLEALIERLERVTSRLERLPQLLPPSPPATPATPASPAPSVTQQDELQLVISDNMSISGFQDIIQGPLRTYLELSKQIGGDVATHANLVGNAFQAQMRYIQLAGSRSKPSQSEEMQLLAPTSEQISAIQGFREKNRASKLFNHLSAISESIPALGWVAIAPTPAPYVKEMNDAGQFYTNRVLKEWKDKNVKHVEWCRAWVQLLTELQAYVKQYHTTGLVWSGKGAGAPPPPPGGMPPPPPVLPAADFSNLSVDDRSALFAEINQGENITSSLRKVTSDMQTHKNPSLRQGPAPFKAASHTPSKALPQPGAGAVDKPPVFARDGKKWLIEYQKGNANLVVENAEMNNVVYMFRCRDSALTVRGKVNGVVLDSCTKCAVVFDNLVSSVEFVNCQSVQMQVLGKVPTISVDKTDGCQIYLSKDALDVEIVSSKSSEMNVLVPKGNGDYTEWPVPEQFKTVVNKSGGLSTTPVESKG
ncbi:adenylyl cyclase-associated protein 1 isoform X2 [Leguminivora glycinivorella]|uniref:adenylyl cyclase-associated protein 1 isoform X2 n=1 Tax=Leguminivora glycinivorella TaxID=1035111 RepID=UPI0020103E95|nr:adenylyl cyclase-associated protein 1 isoform X2 [Leguminivora glycinivorella]